MVRPSAKPVDVSTASDGTVNLYTLTADNFAGDQFVLWWGDNAPGRQPGKIRNFGFGLVPRSILRPADGHERVDRYRVNESHKPVQLQYPDLPGNRRAWRNGRPAYVVPSNITNIFLAPGAWVQGKLRFAWGGGMPRQVYGPGVLDGSRFRYDLRRCDGDPGYHALSWENPQATNSVPDTFLLDGIVITDHNGATDDLLVNGVVNNVKTIGWNGNEWRIQARRQHDSVQRVYSQR